MKTFTVHVGWGCLGLSLGAGLVVLAVAVQALVGLAAVLVEVIGRG